MASGLSCEREHDAEFAPMPNQASFLAKPPLPHPSSNRRPGSSRVPMPEAWRVLTRWTLLPLLPCGLPALEPIEVLVAGARWVDLAAITDAVTPITIRASTL